MILVLRGGTVFTENDFKQIDLTVKDGIIVSYDGNIDNADDVIDISGKYVFPGFVDVHVHFREPGFSYKETIKTGSMAAAHGGYTTVCTMPNLIPCPDSKENLSVQLEAIKKDAAIRVLPYGSITKGEKGLELSDMASIADDVIGFSDDGVGVQDPKMMRSAMNKAFELGKIISAHCEDNSYLRGGKINDCKYAREHGIPGINSESEYIQIGRDISLCEETGVRYHVCHISTKESVELIRDAKARGVNISCETAPHYLLLDDTMLRDSGDFRMNPPLRSPEDRKALISGIKDGTIDMIATDHAPHSPEEKSKGIASSLNGITGLEAAFPVLFTGLVKNGIISLQRLIQMMSVNPAERFGLRSSLSIGSSVDLCVFDLDNKYMLSSDDFFSKGRSTPFNNTEVYGRNLMTVYNGSIVYREGI